MLFTIENSFCTLSTHFKPLYTNMHLIGPPDGAMSCYMLSSKFMGQPLYMLCCKNVFALGNGYIPTTCLREILRELDDQLTNDELDMMIDEIDSDGSGTVDFDGK